MTSSTAREGAAPALDLSATKAAVWLTATAFLALLVLYFVGMDQGATSVFGNNTYIHEFVHDARHLLGFPATDRPVERRLIGRGLLAGALAGVLAFVFARIFVEPVIERAIAFEEGVGAAREAAHGGHEHGAEVFTRTVQGTIGLGFGVLAFAVAMGALFAVVFAVTYGRVGDVSARVLAVVVAGGMLVSLYVVPALKYPANPPAVGLEETIEQRTLLYLLMVVLSAAALVGSIYLGRRLVARLGAWNATLAAGGAYVVAMAVVMWVLPDIDETPGPLRDAAGTILYEGFPADDLYQFRLYSLGVQVVLWLTIGLAFAALVTRLLDGRREESLAA